jgi:hypothetical protein
MSLDGQIINKKPIAPTTTPTENAESSNISIVTSFTVEEQQRQYSETAKLRRSGLYIAFEGEHHINSTSDPEDIEQTRPGQSRSVDPTLPSYGLGNLFPEPYDESSYFFLAHSSP